MISGHNLANINHLILYGAGGHGKAVAFIAQKALPRLDIAFVDDNPERGANPEILFHDRGEKTVCHISIGVNSLREVVFRKVCGEVVVRSIVATEAICHSRVDSFSGTFVGSGAYIGPGCDLGKGLIINTAAVVEHDSVLGDFCHVGPNSTVLGGCRIGARVLIGAGAVVCPNVAIANDVVVKAGSVISQNIEDEPSGLG